MLAPYKLIFQHRVLAMELVRRELFEKYGNAVLGGGWAIIQPLALMLVFAFVFGYIFELRFEGIEVDFAVFMPAGYQVWMTVMIGLSGAATALTGNVGLLKQMDFPSPVLVVKTVVIALIAQAVALTFVISYGLIQFQFIGWMHLLLIPLIIFEILFIIGLGWLLSGITVFFRDMPEFLNTFFLINMYILPIIWPPNQIPGPFAAVIPYNPFTYIIYPFQDVLVYGRFEHPIAWIIFPLMAFFFFHVGYWLFRKMEPVYGDML